MKLRKFLITGLAIMNFLAPLNVAAQEDYKTDHYAKEVAVTAETLFVDNPVYNHNIEYYAVKGDGNTLFWAYPEEGKVYTTQKVNLRTAPSILNDIFATLPKNAELEYLAKSDAGWDLVKVGDEIYFIWNEFITTEKPREEIIEITEDTIQFYKEVYLGTYRLTAYCSCVKCCGKWSGLNKTASGATPRANHTAACNSLPFGTQVRINGIVYTIEDRGNMAGDIIDIYFDSHEAALNSGFGLIKAEVYKVN